MNFQPFTDPLHPSRANLELLSLYEKELTGDDAMLIGRVQ
jgi:hypothetical protein